MDDADAHTFIFNYIVVASLFLLAGVILTLFKERQLKRHRAREWKRCTYGHWATRGQYCSECGLWLAPVPEAQQKRIEYIAGHSVTKHYLTDPVMRLHFALWLVDTERVDSREYMIDTAVWMYKSSWRFHAGEVVEENR